jgi:hypothetical protein
MKGDLDESTVRRDLDIRTHQKAFKPKRLTRNQLTLYRPRRRKYMTENTGILNVELLQIEELEQKIAPDDSGMWDTLG